LEKAVMIEEWRDLMAEESNLMDEHLVVKRGRITESVNHTAAGRWSGMGALPCTWTSLVVLWMWTETLAMWVGGWELVVMVNWRRKCCVRLPVESLREEGREGRVYTMPSSTLEKPAVRESRQGLATAWRKAGEHWRFTLVPSLLTSLEIEGMSLEASLTRDLVSFAWFKKYGATKMTGSLSLILASPPGSGRREEGGGEKREEGGVRREERRREEGGGRRGRADILDQAVKTSR
jgi:hypothetical protein